LRERTEEDEYIFEEFNIVQKTILLRRKQQPIWDEGDDLGALIISIKSELVKEIYNTSKRDLRSKKSIRMFFSFFLIFFSRQLLSLSHCHLHFDSMLHYIHSTITSF